MVAPTHYLNQCWLIINWVMWHSPESNFTGNAQDIISLNGFKNDILKLLPHLLGVSTLQVALRQAYCGMSLWNGSQSHLTVACQLTAQIQETRRLTHWGWDEMNNISQTTFSNVFSSMKIFEFRLKFHWSLFPRVQLTIFQHWFR